MYKALYYGLYSEYCQCDFGISMLEITIEKSNVMETTNSISRCITKAFRIHSLDNFIDMKTHLCIIVMTSILWYRKTRMCSATDFYNYPRTLHALIKWQNFLNDVVIFDEIDIKRYECTLDKPLAEWFINSWRLSDINFPLFKFNFNLFKYNFKIKIICVCNNIDKS